MSNVVKKSVSFRDELWQAVEATAAEEDTTVSAIVNAALENLLAIRAGLRATVEWQAEHGAFTPEEIAEADALLDAVGVTPAPGFSDVALRAS
jgi:hypothetical protein